MDVMGTIEGAFSRVNSTVFRQVNRAVEWWNLPTPVGLLNLRAFRDDLRYRLSWRGVMYDSKRRYDFRSVEQLRYDFERDVQKA